LSVLHVLVGDRKDLHLNRSEPGRERTCKVLDQDSDESLDGAEHNAVDHDRSVLLSVCACVFQVKPERELEVKLDRTALPCSSDGILQMEVDLRSVERAVSFIYNVGQADVVKR